MDDHLDDPTLWSATEQAAAIRHQQISSRELLSLEVERIERLNPSLNAVVTLDLERAEAAASAADERTARGGPLGPLHGLAVTIKDAIEVEGIRSTGGATELADHVPDRDAPAVARLKAAGAVIFGKTNVPRWSGDLQTFNELFGTTNNPWDLARTPGGSSGGAAVAVATGMSSFELGTDIGGSIRMPAHLTGICGHKPSWGLVSQRGYLDRIGGAQTEVDISVFGPLARSVADLALVLDVVVGPDDDLAPAWQVTLPPARATTAKGLRVGTWFTDPRAPIDAGILRILEGAAEALGSAGAQVNDDRPRLDLAEVASLFDQLIVAAISPSLPEEIGNAFAGSHRQWLLRQDARTGIRRIWAEWFTNHDVLLCPVLPVTAFPHDQHGTVVDRSVPVNGVIHSHAQLLAWPGLVGVSSLPATVVPVGHTEGLPVGIQIVGPYLGDRTCLAAAAVLEALCGGYVPPPMVLEGDT